MAKETFGLQQAQILKRSLVYRDVRPFPVKCYEDWTVPSSCITFAFLSLILMAWFPVFVDALLVCMATQGSLTILRFSDGRFRLPMRMPMHSGFKKDLASRKASEKNKFKKAEGIFYIGKGTDRGGDYELWLDSKDMGTHTLILGTTGAGKTVAMQSLAYSFLSIGGGLIYVDPKASPSLLFEFFVICRRLGRDCDMRILNFGKDKLSTSLEKSIIIKPDRVSNTMNPLAMGTSSDIITILCSLLPKDDGGSNAVFKQKGILLLQSIVPLLVKLRDMKMLELSISVLNAYMDAEKAVCMVYPKNAEEKKMAESFQNCIDTSVERKKKNMERLNQKVTTEEEKSWRKNAIKMYVQKNMNDNGTCNLPDFIRFQAYFEANEVDDMKRMLKSVNYVEDVPLYGSPGSSQGGQKQTFFDQYTYGRSYFSQSMATMSQEFGPIFNALAGEADMYDVIFNNRIMIVNIPSLSLSPDETSTIGKIVLAQTKSGIAYGLPSKIEGSAGNILESAVSVARAPMGVFVDEYAAISCPGFAVVCTQARSLGFCAVIGTQDIPGLEKADKNEAGMILANTSVKFFMRQKCPKETWDLADKLFGQRLVQKRNFRDPEEEKAGDIERVSVVSLDDLKSQNEGEFHCSFDEQCIRGKFPYMVPNTTGSQLRLIRSVITGLPDPELIKGLQALQRKNADKIGMKLAA